MSGGNKTIHIKYYALLREESGISVEDFITASAKVSALYSELKQKYKFTLSEEKLKVALNDEFCNLDAAIKDGDKIVFIPPVAGG